jgi:hypothetical protein
MVAPRRLDSSTRRKLEVASAMAWEALVDTHVEQATWLVLLLADHEGVEDALPRYLREMDLSATMAAAIRTRVLANLEAAEAHDAGAVAAAAEQPAADWPGAGAGTWPRSDDGGDDDDDADDGSGWSLLRQPQRVVRGVRERQRRGEEFDRLLMLGLARAEERVIQTHVENAIGFVALLEASMALDRSVLQYLGAVRLTGGRAQTVFQRTMARLADVHLS